MVGQVISHYRILERTGAGGMGVVYKAEDLALKRIVALKFLPPDLTRDPEARSRFVHEAQAASSLDHSNICAIHEIGEQDGQTFIVMGYYEGGTLGERIKKGPLPIDTAIEICRQVGLGLARAHEAGIIHRDIKPANILLTNRGEVKIVDFGLAKLSGQTLLTVAGSTLGTAAYMSPEQAEGQPVDGRSDIWSLGVVLYEMLTGRRPFQGDFEQALIYSVLNVDPAPPRNLRQELPRALEQVVLRAMSKRPEDRYQRMDDVVADLDLLKGGREAPGVMQAAVHARKKLRTRVFVVSAAAVLICAVAAYFILPANSADEALAANPRTIAVMRLENQTGEASEDHIGVVIQDAIASSLEQSPFFRVTTRERIHDILKQMGRQASDTIDHETGLEICRREGTEAMIVGSYARAGGLFVTSLRIVDVGTAKTLKTFKATGMGVESILRVQIDELCEQVSRGFGVSSRSTHETLRPVAEMITSSIEAYDFYVNGRREADRYNLAEARRCYRKALVLDSTFALSWWSLSTISDDPNEITNAEEHARRYLNRIPEKDRLHAQAHLYPDRYWTTIRAAIEKYPREKEFYCCIATEGFLFQRRDYREAITYYTKALELDPEYYWPLESLSILYNAIGQPGVALTFARRYVDAHPTYVAAYENRGDALFALGDFQRADSSYRIALELNPLLNRPLIYRRFYLFALNEDYGGAERFIEEQLRRSDGTPDEADIRLMHAILLGWRGMATAALKECRVAETLQAPPFIDAERSWLYSGIGRSDSAATCLDRYERRVALVEDSLPRYQALSLVALLSGMWATAESGPEESRKRLSALRDYTENLEEVYRDRMRHLGDLLYAEILLKQDSVDQAISCATRAAPWKSCFLHPYFENSPRAMNTWNFCWPLTDVLARALARKGEVARAIEEYERLTQSASHGARKFLIHPLYYYRLAALYAARGDNGRAAERYATFIRLWKNADRTHPELREAQRYLAKVLAAGRTNTAP